MSGIDMTPAAMLQYFQQIAGSFGGNIFGDGTGTEMAMDPANGDTITYDPAMQTANDGVQPALSVIMGGEQLTEFGNGAATVTSSNGNTLAIDNGELYGMSAGASQRVDLGSATSPQGWITAMLDGYATPQGAEDLEKTATLGMSAAPSFQQAFGSSSVSNGNGNGHCHGHHHNNTFNNNTGSVSLQNIELELMQVMSQIVQIFEQMGSF